MSHYDCVSKMYFEYNGTFDKLHLSLSFLSFHVSVATGRTGDSRVDRGHMVKGMALALTEDRVTLVMDSKM